MRELGQRDSDGPGIHQYHDTQTDADSSERTILTTILSAPHDVCLWGVCADLLECNNQIHLEIYGELWGVQGGTCVQPRQDHVNRDLHLMTDIPIS